MLAYLLKGADAEAGKALGWSGTAKAGASLASGAEGPAHIADQIGRLALEAKAKRF